MKKFLIPLSYVVLVMASLSWQHYSVLKTCNDGLNHSEAVGMLRSVGANVECSKSIFREVRIRVNVMGQIVEIDHTTGRIIKQ